MTRSRHRATLILPPLIVAFLLSGCHPKAEEDDWIDSAAGDDTPIEDRQYIDDYATDIVPAILDFLDELSKTGAGEWNNGEESPWFGTHECLLTDYEWEPDGYDISLKTAYGARRLPPEIVAESGDKIFPGLGFSAASIEQVDRLVHVSWIDWYNGGSVSVTLDESRTMVSSRSECRYARDIEATRQHIQELAPRPSDSPTPPGTPSPTPGQTRTRPRTTHRP